jgi:hypothetical protein
VRQQECEDEEEKEAKGCHQGTEDRPKQTQFNSNNSYGIKTAYT